MRVVRGRGADPESDAQVTAGLLERTKATGEPGLRVWRPHRQVTFGRRDARSDGYQRAREIAAEHGFPAIERQVGGRAVAYSGTTIAFGLARPVADIRRGIEARYEATTMAVQRALWRLGVPVQRGEPSASFCPGNHALQWRGKLAGFAQRVQQGAAIVGGIVIVRDHEAIAGVLEPVYEALEVPFDPDTVGSIERAGGTDDPDAVRTGIEEALIGDDETTVESVDGSNGEP